LLKIGLSKKSHLRAEHSHRAYSAPASACDAARPSVEAYKQLGEALEHSQRLATDHPQADTEAEAAYNKAFEEATADWLDGEHTDEQIPAAITDVRAFTNGYLTADARKLRTEFADITHLLINADFSDDITNWTLVTGKAGYSGSVGYDPFPFLVALMIAVSSSFATPIGSPTHMLVYSPGGYRFSDLMRVGLPMNIIILAANIFIVNLVYPLMPLH